jgi:hypothetical protein
MVVMKNDGRSNARSRRAGMDCKEQVRLEKFVLVFYVTNEASLEWLWERHPANDACDAQDGFDGQSRFQGQLG